MRVFLGMILGALLLVAGVYTYDSMQTSTVANGEVAQALKEKASELLAKAPSIEKIDVIASKLPK